MRVSSKESRAREAVRVRSFIERHQQLICDAACDIGEPMTHLWLDRVKMGLMHIERRYGGDE